MNEKDKALMRFDDYMSDNAYYIYDDETFLDKCLDYLGKWLKSIGNKGLEFLKQKYMIGKYSRNLRGKLSIYNKMKPIYQNLQTLASIIETEIYDKQIYNTYIKQCNLLNSMCRKFKDVLPELDYFNPLNASNNYLTIKQYMNNFSGRNGILIR